MSEKRRISTRNRGEPPLKKRALSPSPPPPRAAAPVPRPPPPTEPTEEGLPFRLKEGRPLPTLADPQALKLSSKAYQSISESGVLATSIERSRQKWMTDGVFERYWSRPSKKKDMNNTPNPAKETMTRLGICSMIIDPHVFEVTLYSVKESQIVYPPTPSQAPSFSAPQYNTFPHGGSYSAQKYSPPSTTPHPLYQPQQPKPPSQPTLPPFREGFGSFAPQGPSPNLPPSIQPAVPLGPPVRSDLSRSHSTSQGPFQGDNGDPKPDPVIQMLATRAASDSRLKGLMKVVASGAAEPAQLKEFQGHIDELNTLIQSRQNSPTSNTSHNNHMGQPPPNSSAAPPQSLNHLPNANPPWTKADAGSIYTNPYQAPTPVKIEPTVHPSPLNTPSGSTKPASQKRTDIDGVVFDFGGSGDRFSFPRFSILEYLFGGTQVIVSFLVIRRGNTAPSGKYKGTSSYYQPVTIRLTSQNPKLLEPLARIVAPSDEVRQYMNSFFDKLSPADSVYLATKLPRSTESQDFQEHDVPAEGKVHSIYPAYSPPSSIMPLAA